MPEVEAPTLKPCPFCQQAVKAVLIEGAGYSLVGCDNRECPASDISCFPERWNTRANLAPRVNNLDALVSDIAQDVSTFFLDENAEYNLDTLPSIIRLHLAKFAPRVREAAERATAEIINMDINGVYDPHDPHSRNAIIEIITRHCSVASDAGELISRAEAVRVAEEFTELKVTDRELAMADAIADELRRLPTVPAADAEAMRRVQNLAHDVSLYFSWRVGPDEKDLHHDMPDKAVKLVNELCGALESLEVVNGK